MIDNVITIYGELSQAIHKRLERLNQLEHLDDSINYIREINSLRYESRVLLVVQRFIIGDIDEI